MLFSCLGWIYGHVTLKLLNKKMLFSRKYQNENDDPVQLKYYES